MNPIPNVQNVPVMAWDGTAATARDITKHTRFGFTFEATADIAADAVFTVQSAPPSAADPCVPGAFTDVEEVPICTAVAAGTLAQITIPAGTKKGAICHAGLPCRPDKFIKLVAAGGDTANLIGLMVLSGPTG